MSPFPRLQGSECNVGCLGKTDSSNLAANSALLLSMAEPGIQLVKQKTLRSVGLLTSTCIAGQMVGWKKFKERVFSSGIEPSLRQTAWKFLLGFYSYDSTLAERRAQLASKRAEYARMKSQWRTLNDEQASR